MYQVNGGSLEWKKSCKSDGYILKDIEKKNLLNVKQDFLFPNRG